MIRINLLPESYRKPERTSPKVFAAALIGVFGAMVRGSADPVIQQQATTVAEA